MKMATTNLYLGSSATTGDMKNNMSKLLREIRNMKLEVQLDIQGWSLGTPASFLPLWHAALMYYSLPLANVIAAQGYELYGKSDLRFLQGVYGVLRDIFQFQPRLPKEKFLRSGYAERKVILTLNILLLCQAKHKQLLASAGGKRSLSKYKGVRVSSDDLYQPPVTREDGLELVQQKTARDRLRCDLEKLTHGPKGLGCGFPVQSSVGRRPLSTVAKSDDLYPMRMAMEEPFYDMVTAERRGTHSEVAVNKEQPESRIGVGHQERSRQDLELAEVKTGDPLPAINSISPVCTSSPEVSRSLSVGPEVNVEVIRHKFNEGKDEEMVVKPPPFANVQDTLRLETDRDTDTGKCSEKISGVCEVSQHGQGSEVSSTEITQKDLANSMRTDLVSRESVVSKEAETKLRKEGESRGDGVGSNLATIESLSNRVEELGRLVEQIVARCVLVETQIKLANVQHTHPPRPQHTPPPHTQHMPPPLSQHTPSSSGTRDKESQLKSRSQKVTEHNGGPEGNYITTSECCRSPVHGPVPYEGSYGIAMPTTPSTEETEQLIRNLRLRTQTTRQFLQQVTSARPNLQQWE